jgi:hypothetical protein
MDITIRIIPTPIGIHTTLTTGELAYTWDIRGGGMPYPGGGALFIPPITMDIIRIGTIIITMATTGIQAITTIATGQDITTGTIMDIMMVTMMDTME